MNRAARAETSRPAGRRPGDGAVLVASHPRSGTHLLMDVLRRHFPACDAGVPFGGNPHDWLYFSLDRLGVEHPRKIGHDVGERVLARIERPLLKSHARPAFDETDPAERAFLDDLLARSTMLYVVRDGRQVMASYLTYREAFDAGAERTLGGFMRQEENGLVRPAYWARHARAWMDEPRAHIVRFEDLIREPEHTLQRLGEILGMTPLMREPLIIRPTKGRVRTFIQQRLLRRFESTNILGGRPTPKWPEVFSREDREYFESHAGDVLRDLGYTDGPGWVAEG